LEQNNSKFNQLNHLFDAMESLCNAITLELTQTLKYDNAEVNVKINAKNNDGQTFTFSPNDFRP